MKKLFFAILFVATILCCQSCFSSGAVSYEPYDEYVISDNVDVNVIITYGTPYYYNGQLWYYLYNGLYYYPFYYDNYWYFRPYTTLYTWDWYYYHYHHFVPTYRDYRFRPHHHDWNKPPHHGHGPNVVGGHGRPNHQDGRRPSINNGNYGNHNGAPHNNGGINNGRPHNNGNGVRPNIGNGSRPTPPRNSGRIGSSVPRTSTPRSMSTPRGMSSPSIGDSSRGHSSGSGHVSGGHRR